MQSRAATRILKAIQQPSDRSKQRLVGCSQLGGCPYHLGLAMLESKSNEHTPSESGMAAWIGTGVHYWLEHHLELEGAEHETKVSVLDLEGYGEIGGHVDLVYANQVWDYKVLGKYSFDKMRLEYLETPARIPKTVYRAQQNLYAYGLRKLGYDITHVNIIAFPKISNNWEDIRVFTEAYNEELVQAVLARTKLVWKYCQEGRVEELPKDDDCYDCSRW